MMHIHHVVAADALERSRRTPEAPAALRWWRTTEPQSLDAAASAMLQAAMIASLPNHPPAATGAAVKAPVDAARVIRAALLTAAWHNPPAWALDLAGSALLICAADGNATARLVLDHFRRRFAAPKATSSNRGEA
jgi:hypothetical protein